MARRRRLQEQRVVVPLGGSLQVQQAPRLVAPGSMLRVENLVQTRSGELRTRPGGTEFSDDGYTDGDGFRLACLGSKIYLLGQAGVRQNSAATDGPIYQHVSELDQWIGSYVSTAHSSAAVRVERRAIATRGAPSDDTQSQRAPSTAYNSTQDYILTAWEDSADNVIYYVIRGATSGALLQTGSIFDAVNPRVVGASGNYFAIIHTSTTSLNIRSLRVDVSGTTLPFPTATHSFQFIGGTAGAQEALDVMWVSTTYVLVSYRSTIGNNIRVTEYNPTTGGSTSWNVAIGATVNATGWMLDNHSNSAYYLVYHKTGGGIEFVAFTAGVGAGAATVLDAGAVDTDQITGYMLNGSGAFVAFYDETTDPDTDGSIAKIIIGHWTGSVVGGITGGVYMRDAALLSHAFLRDGHYWFLARNNSPLTEVKQNTDMLVPANDPSALIKSTDPGAAAIFNRWEAGLPMPHDPSHAQGGRLDRPSDLGADGVLAVVTVNRRLLEDPSGADLVQVAQELAIRPNDVSLGPHVEYGGQLYFPGGILTTLSGSYIGESDPLFYPHKPTLTSSGTPGSLTGSSTYTYVFVYAVVNSNGDVVRSAPSVPLNVTTSGGHTSVNWEIGTLRIGGRSLVDAFSSCTIEIYRTTSGPGSNFFLAGVATNTPTTDTVTGNDGLSDADLQTQEPLYTTGGVLEAHQPPPTLGLALYKDRLFAIDGDRPTNLWFTLRKTVGQAFRWNETQRLEIDDGTGDITALAVLAERLLIFKRRAIYLLQGEGPNDLGQGGYSSPQQLTSDVGTDNPLSVVVTSMGVFFQETESRDIHLIGLDLSHQFVGLPVQGLTNDRITGAMFLREERHVRFYTDDADAAGATTLNYDITHGSWSTFTNQAAKHAISVQGVPHYLTAAGKVVKEDPSTTDPSSTNVVGVFETPNLQLAGVGGYKRIWELLLLGDVIGAGSIQAELFYDASTTTADETFTYAPPGAEKLEMHMFPSRQQCSSLRVRVSMSYGMGESSAAGGTRFTALVMRLGVKPGLDKGVDVTSRE